MSKMLFPWTYGICIGKASSNQVITVQLRGHTTSSRCLVSQCKLAPTASHSESRWKIGNGVWSLGLTTRLAPTEVGGLGFCVQSVTAAAVSCMPLRLNLPAVCAMDYP